MQLILLGAPGAGKGTQGARLAEHLGIRKIATGDMLRDAVRADTPLGREAKGFMDAGELVPDEVILGMVREALQAPDASDGVIFDGFPRTIPQAESLDTILSDAGRPLDAVIVIEVDDDAIVERMVGRRTDPETGRVYHVRFNPPPAEIVERVVQREDDREETVRRRLAVYREQTAPLIRYYGDSDTPVHAVDGAREIDLVQRDLRELLAR
jgi:adenylate kinase